LNRLWDNIKAQNELKRKKKAEKSREQSRVAQRRMVDKQASRLNLYSLEAFSSISKGESSQRLNEVHTPRTKYYYPDNDSMRNSKLTQEESTFAENDEDISEAFEELMGEISRYEQSSRMKYRNKTSHV